MDMIFSVSQMRPLPSLQIPHQSVWLRNREALLLDASHDLHIRQNLSTSPDNYTKARSVVYYISEKNQHGHHEGCVSPTTLFSILLVASAYHKQQSIRVYAPSRAPTGRRGAVQHAPPQRQDKSQSNIRRWQSCMVAAHTETDLQNTVNAFADARVSPSTWQR